MARPSRRARVGDADAVDLGQPQVDAGDVRRELADLLERLAAVAHLPDELELGPGAHGAHDAFPEERVVVGDDHAIPGHGPIVDGRPRGERPRRTVIDRRRRAVAGSGRSSTARRAMLAGCSGHGDDAVRMPAGRRSATRVPAACMAVAVMALGLGLFARYVRDYVLYRGFGPPVALVAPGRPGDDRHAGLPSPALGGRTERALVYLPAAYRTQPRLRFPVAYLLHGTPGDPRTAFVNSLHVAPRLDLLILRHRVRPLIVVMPPGSPSTYDRATEWANAPGRDARWFSYLTHDLIHAVDARLRTIPQRLRSRHRRLLVGRRRGAQRDPPAPAPVLGRRGLERGLPPDARDRRPRCRARAAFLGARHRAPASPRAGRDRCSRLSLRGPARSRHAEHDARRARPAAGRRARARRPDRRRPCLGALVGSPGRIPALLLRSPGAGRGHDGAAHPRAA